MTGITIRFACACLLGGALASFLSGCGGGSSTQDLASRLAGTQWKAVSVSGFSKTDDRTETSACPGSIDLAPTGDGSAQRVMSCDGDEVSSFTRNSDGTLFERITVGGSGPPGGATYQVVDGRLVFTGPVITNAGTIGPNPYTVTYSVTFSGSAMTITQVGTTDPATDGNVLYNGSSTTYQRQ